MEWSAFQWRAGGTPELRPLKDLSEEEGSTILLDLEADGAILIAGAGVRRLPRGSGRADLLERAATGAAAWERERLRTWRRLLLPDQLLCFAEKLNQADEVEGVCRALCESVIDTVGAYEAILMLGPRGGGTMYSSEMRLQACNGHPLSFPSHPRVWRPGVVTAAEALADLGTPFSVLGPLFTDAGAAAIAHVPVGSQGILLLVERRKDRIFEAEDWSLLRNLASQADGALRRVHSLEEVRQLSLTDPLTGLANRRRMEVVVDHSWAAAKRGKPLTVVLIDLDHFKKINDEQGHLAGDRMLQLVATVLQEEVRGTDLVVRYGGDEFLVLLPGEGARGASSLIGRVQSRLARRVEFSAGIAEYREAVRSPQDLIAEADSNLYEVKRQLRWRSG